MDYSESGFPVLYFPPVSSEGGRPLMVSLLISNNLDLSYFKKHGDCDLTKMSDERHSLYVETQGEHIEAGVKECVEGILDVITECVEIFEGSCCSRESTDQLILEEYHCNQVKLQQDTISRCTRGTDTLRYCENCSFDEETIETRNRDMNNDNLWFHYHKRWGCSKLCCLSCLLHEDRKEELEDPESTVDDAAVCETCGLCELMEDVDGDTLEGTFTLCETNSSTCPHVWLCSQCCENDSVYEGEFENEDLPEDNSEKMKKIKDAVKEAGDLVYDIQDKISEGEYLKLMDSLQKITNEANSS